MDRSGTDAAIAANGTTLGPDVLERTRALFAGEQEGLAVALPPLATDLAYGPDPRQRLDLYRDGPGEARRPVLLFVHGGGFVRGDKAVGWANANVGRMAARAGMVGAVMNYRLAPDATWPSGGDDVAAAVSWLATNAADHGGDPARIIAVGTSAGAVHVATAIQRHADLATRLRGVALVSGLYGYTPLDDRDHAYLASPTAEQDWPVGETLVSTDLPLFVAGAEHDPPRFRAEYDALLAARDGAGRPTSGGRVAGHNHYSITLHLGTADRRLADPLIEFSRQCFAPGQYSPNWRV